MEVGANTELDYVKFHVLFSLQKSVGQAKFLRTQKHLKICQHIRFSNQ